MNHDLVNVRLIVYRTTKMSNVTVFGIQIFLCYVSLSVSLSTSFSLSFFVLVCLPMGVCNHTYENQDLVQNKTSLWPHRTKWPEHFWKFSIFLLPLVTAICWRTIKCLLQNCITISREINQHDLYNIS